MIGIGSASAQTTAPAPDAKAAPKAPKKERTAKSIECSKKADEQGLHGKKRQEFRQKCKKGEM
jgi:hypothetical protein